MRPKEITFPTIQTIATAQDGYAYKCDNGVFVIQTLESHKDKQWLHTSFSRKNRMPDYKDMKYVKERFIGSDNRAIMILPEQENHVNLHKFTLHFFTAIGDDGLPDFTGGTGSL